MTVIPLSRTDVSFSEGLHVYFTFPELIKTYNLLIPRDKSHEPDLQLLWLDLELYRSAVKEVEALKTPRAIPIDQIFNFCG